MMLVLLCCKLDLSVYNMAQPLVWPPNKPVVPPARVEQAGEMWNPPPTKVQLSQIGPRMHGLRTDEEYDEFMKENKSKTGCFMRVQYEQLQYAVAQVDYMKERAKSIRYSPTFVFFRNGKKVDEVLGKNAQKLEDHLWLQSDE